MEKFGNLLWGLVLIIVGVIFGLNALDVTNINVFFDGWWTLFIIVPCFIGLFKDNEKTGSIIGLIIGISLLLASQDFINFDMVWKLMVPAILVIIGLSVIFKDSINSGVRKQINKLNKGNLKDYCATFGGQDINFSNEKFEGCNLTAVFGGVKCDLKDALFSKDVVINTSAIFGGITIYVPSDVNVKVTSIPIFGGVSNDKRNNKDAKVTIYINATSIFGGVDIK